MKLRRLLIAFLALVPCPAAAETSAICASLFRRLAASPEVIGSTAEVRLYAQDLARRNADIRSLRSQMRRAGCGGGSIVVLGRSSSGACSEMSEDLRHLEAERQSILARRDAARQIRRPDGERATILAAIRTNACEIVPEARPLPIAVDPTETPAGEAAVNGIPEASSITKFAPTANDTAASQEVLASPPERPYDPDQKVRVVGPRFLPEESSIDLANPKR